MLIGNLINYSFIGKLLVQAWHWPSWHLIILKSIRKTLMCCVWWIFYSVTVIYCVSIYKPQSCACSSLRLNVQRLSRVLKLLCCLLENSVPQVTNRKCCSVAALLLRLRAVFQQRLMREGLLLWLDFFLQYRCFPLDGANFTLTPIIFL